MHTKVKSPSIPDLRIVPIAAVLPHEEHDPQRSEPLIQRIERAGVWLNPPIVAPLEESDNAPHPEGQRYVVLDGANRTYSLGALRVPHILVQVVDYFGQDVALYTWNHALSEIKAEVVLQHLNALDGIHLQPADQDTAEAALEAGSAMAYVHVLPDTYYLIISEQRDFESRTIRLRDVVDTYKHQARIDRVDHDNNAILAQLHPDARLVVVFPQYDPREILRAARHGLHLPPGISRHIIQGRAMRLNYPLEALRDTETPLKRKNIELQDWIRKRVAQKRMRLYQEAIYIFDD